MAVVSVSQSNHYVLPSELGFMKKHTAIFFCFNTQTNKSVLYLSQFNFNKLGFLNLNIKILGIFATIEIINLSKRISHKPPSKLKSSFYLFCIK